MGSALSTGGLTGLARQRWPRLPSLLTPFPERLRTPSTNTGALRGPRWGCLARSPRPRALVVRRSGPEDTKRAVWYGSQGPQHLAGRFDRRGLARRPVAQRPPYEWSHRKEGRGGPLSGGRPFCVLLDPTREFRESACIAQSQARLDYTAHSSLYRPGSASTHGA